MVIIILNEIYLLFCLCLGSETNTALQCHYAQEDPELRQKCFS